MFLRVVKVLQHTAEGDRTCPLQVGVSQQQGQARSLTLTDHADYFFYFSVTITPLAAARASCGLCKLPMHDRYFYYSLMRAERGI